MGCDVVQLSWETERDTKLNNATATIQPSKNDKHSALTFVPINLAAGLCKLVDERGVVVGADDGLVVGDVEVIRRSRPLFRVCGLSRGRAFLRNRG